MKRAPWKLRFPVVTPLVLAGLLLWQVVPSIPVLPFLFAGGLALFFVAGFVVGTWNALNPAPAAPSSQGAHHDTVGPNQSDEG
jgi:hypothetical protein